MIISQLIEILEDAKYYYGDSEILLLKGERAYPVTFLGSIEIQNKDECFFLTADTIMKGCSDLESNLLVAPKAPVQLRIVK